MIVENLLARRTLAGARDDRYDGVPSLHLEHRVCRRVDIDGQGLAVLTKIEVRAVGMHTLGESEYETVPVTAVQYTPCSEHLE